MAVKRDADHFHNPYTFVPTHDRLAGDGPFNDRAPTGHAVLADDTWSGRVSVTATVMTPLILPGQHQKLDDDHRVLGLRRGADGAPYLAPTTLKGALRSLFEAATASRYGVLEDHDEMLAFRMTTRDGAAMKPIRVVADGDGWKAELLDLAFLPVPEAKKHNHLAEVEVTANRYLHHRGQFEVFVVDQVDGEAASKESRHSSVDNYQLLDGPHVRKGIVYRTGADSIARKKWERVFLIPSAPTTIRLTERHEKMMRSTMSAYAAAAADRERAGNGKARHHNPAHTDEWAWRDGLVCYARVDDGTVVAMSPVPIGRETYTATPREAMFDSVLPATSWDALSAADRIFGWVHPDGGAETGRTALRSAVRVHSVSVVGDVTDHGAEGVVLRPLSGPKPAYARFYVGDEQGDVLDLDPQTDAVEKRDVGYAAGDNPRRPRGRKIYPPHRSLEDEPDWWSPNGYGAQTWSWHERTNQNASVTAWVAPTARVSFSVDVRNLDAADLGALLWILSPFTDHGGDTPTEEQRRLRVGAAKPLGFGTVRVDDVVAHVETGADAARRLRSFDAGLPEPLGTKTLKGLESEFSDALRSVVDQGLTNNAAAGAVDLATRGFADGLPVHYPRTDRARPDQESYSWFVDNEAIVTRRNELNGDKLPLPQPTARPSGGKPSTVPPLPYRPQSLNRD